MTARKVTIELSDDDVAHLRTLATSESVSGNTVEAVFRELLERIADGVRRPGSWEREWLRAAFSTDWEASLERVDDHRDRPNEWALLRDKGVS